MSAKTDTTDSSDTSLTERLQSPSVPDFSRAGELARQEMEKARELDDDNRGIMREIQLVGGGLIMLLVVTLVLTEVHAAIDLEGGPFEEIVGTVEGTGVAALTLLVVGFLVIAASAIMRFFGTGFGGR